MTKLFFLFLFLHISFSVISQDLANSLLWKIEGTDANKTSYLYGTIHMVKKEDFKIKKKVNNAFNTCTVLALEINLNISLKDKMKLAMETLLPKGQNIKDFMSKKDFLRLRSYAIDSIHISKKKFNKYIRLKPFFLSSVLIKESLGKIKSYDEEFYKMSSKKNMTNVGLEKIEEQLSLINKISNKDQIMMMMEGIQKNNDNSFENLTNAYIKEDLITLNKIIINESADLKEFQFNFIEKRNRNWIPVIKKLIKDQNTFIAVGAGHLGGKNGLISLLRENGYNLVPVFK